MATQPRKAMNPVEWALLIVLSVLWGGSFFFSKIAIAELQPFSTVLGRVALAAIALVVLVYARGLRLPRTLGVWTAFFAMGALNNVVPFSLIFWGQTQIASALAAILNATTPLFTVVVAHFLTRDERLTQHRLTGVLLGAAGVAVMVDLGALSSLGTHRLAEIAVLGAALSYAFAGIFGRRFRALPPVVTAAGQLTASSVMIFPLVAWIDRPWLAAAPSATAWSALFALALLSTALAYVIYFRVLATAGPTNLLLVTFLIPISAFALGATILGERLLPQHFIGMALIGLGLGAIDGRPLAALAKRLNRRAIAPTESVDRYDI